MSDAVGTLGYAFVDVRPNIRRNKDNLTVDVTFDIQEGPRVYVERINISGNTRTLDKVIRREFRLAEGDAFSTAKVRRSQQRLKNLGFFEKVDVSAAPGSSPDKTNLEVQVVEQSTGEISFGAGFSTTSGILGDISIQERNLLGKGQDLRLGLSLGTLSTLIDLSFTEPYFLDRAVAAGFDIFRTSNDRQNIASYSDRSLGFALRAGWAYTEHTRQTVRYTLRQTDIYNVQPYASSIVQRRRATSVVSEVSETIAWDTRDTRLNTTKGWLLRNTLAVAAWAAPSTTSAPRSTRVIYQTHHRGLSSPRSAARSARSLPYNGSIAAPQQPLLHRRRHVARLRGRRHRPARRQHHRLAGRQVLSTPARPSSASRSACPRRSASSARPSSMSVRCGASADRRSTASAVLDSQLMRVSTGLGIQWISPFGPIRVDYAIPLQQEFVGQDRELPLQLRHALLSGDGAVMNMQTDKTSMATRPRRRSTSSGSCR